LSQGGHENFLEPFKAGEQAFGVAFKEAKSLTSDNPAQQARLDKLMANHQQFMAVASALVELRRNTTAGQVTQNELLQEFSAGKVQATPELQDAVYEALQATTKIVMEHSMNVLFDNSDSVEAYAKMCIAIVNLNELCIAEATKSNGTLQ
jgi:methyl-accepting chemotaxis protein